MAMKKEKQATGIAHKLVRLRGERKMSLEELSAKTGFDLDYLKKIEEGEELPPVGDMLVISRALTVDPDALLVQAKGEKPDAAKKRIEDFRKRESSYLYTVLTPKAGDKHLRAFRVVIPPKSEHPKIGYHHEGEEFVYVLSGQVEITVGQKKHRLKKDETLHFDSGIRHDLKNTGTKETVLIVTIYTP